MKRNAPNGTAHCVILYQRPFALPLFQNIIPAQRKQQELAVPPYNNELGNCL